MNSDDLKNSLEGLFSGLDSAQGEEEKSQLAHQIRSEKPAALSQQSSGGEKQKVDKVPPHPLTLSENNLSRSQLAKVTHLCPYLGLTNDRDSRFSYPEAAHRCFVARKESSVSLDYQARFCLAEYTSCSRFVDLPADLPSVHSTVVSPKTGTNIDNSAPKTIRQTLIWGVVGLLLGLLIVGGIYFRLGSQQNPPLTDQPVQVVLTFTATPTSTQEAISEITPTSAPIALLVTPTPTVTPLPGNRVYELAARLNDVGWVNSRDERSNHFGDSYLYSGIFEGQIYQGAFQFDLSSIPRGAPIHSGVIHLTGLRDDRLAVHIDRSRTGGVWSVRLLAPEIDRNWSRHSYQNIFSAAVLQTLNPILSDNDLVVGQTNVFELSSASLKLLEQRITEDEEPKVSFRVDGPVIGPDNLFAWDTGYGPESEGNRVNLILNVGSPPATPPPYKYVVVTSTPTPQNVLTAAAMVVQMTADATRSGTATPVPPNMVTATPIPDYLIITPTPLPENAATARALIAVATAQALTTGTPPPIPTNAITATPTKTPTPTAMPNYVIITSTPTPDTIFAAATLSAETTAQARAVGTSTPLPEDWVTPVVVTPTPTPLNAATAQMIAAVNTAIAFTTGTPTPIPPNIVTATPTPVYNVIPYLMSTPPPPMPTVAPVAPPALLGKILFNSDREGYEEGQSLTPREYETLTGNIAPPPGSLVYAPDPTTGERRQYIIRPPSNIYVYDPKTGELGRLTEAWPYDVVRDRDGYSADRVYHTYAKQQLWTNVEVPQPDGSTSRVPTVIISIHFYDFKYQQEKLVTQMGAGMAYDPVWSPVSNQIAFVSTESGNDEIWIINHDGTDPRQLTRNTWEWDKSPTWSPDGKQIVFMSNRTGNQQLWIMNVDGSDQRLLMGWDNWTPYNDWGPVWVKYLDPPPPANQ